MAIRVLIVDNQQLFTEALRNLLELEDDIEVVGEAYDGVTGLEKIAATRPDVAVVDLRMPGLNGIEVAQRVKNEVAPEVRIMILTATEEDEFLTRAVEVGVEGYLTKDIAMEVLAGAIRRVVAGETVVPPNRLKHLLRNLTQPDRRGTDAGAHMASYLTDREKEVLSLLVAGKSNSAIGEALYISSNTVRTHIQNILSKLSVHSKLEAVAFAIKHNIVEVERAS
ncbi:MAG: response regulator transcription factor [Acidimicrobiia bacterium]|nr:response regulator transcription factor [Acidimicrobiia bacterium]